MFSFSAINQQIYYGLANLVNHDRPILKQHFAFIRLSFFFFVSAVPPLVYFLVYSLFPRELFPSHLTLCSSVSSAFCCHESGATVLAVAQRQQLLITGGRKGWISVLELAPRHQRKSFQAHDSPIKALAVDVIEDCFISGSAEGTIKVIRLCRL